ncbi:hypothetical protein EMPS_03377 [Entomortierella parvispora]|uniref:Crinkler effector protein N-terminal domain-containing protein n=1 Tax=Entomortierella parvispora TaxID=205924 RepID=A0A9P3H794_9FUNG|nr:hypothetical protein EMPS_03377 [Entomortierella parvispora]
MERILCLISGKIVSEAFAVDIDLNRSVQDLKEVIWQRLRIPPTTPHRPPWDMMLWSVKLTNLEWKQPVKPIDVDKVLMLYDRPIKTYTLKTLDGDKKPSWCVEVLVEFQSKTAPISIPTPEPQTRKISHPKGAALARSAADLEALQKSLHDMMIKAAPLFEKASETLDNDTSKSKESPKQQTHKEAPPDHTLTEDKQTKIQTPPTTDDKQKKPQDLATVESTKQAQPDLQSILRKEIEALSLKHERSMAALKKEVEELRRLCNLVEFNIVVVPRSKDEGFTWPTLIEKTTVEELENAIYNQYPERSNRDGTAMLLVMHSNNSVQPPRLSKNQDKEPKGSELLKNDTQLRHILYQFQKTGKKTLTLSLETPDRPFTSFTFKHVVNLFQITDEKDPIISDISCLVDFAAKVYDRGLQVEAKRRMLDELDSRIQFMGTTDMGENVRDFVCPFLAQAGLVFKGELRLKSQKLITGRYGQGTMDFAIEPSPKGSSNDSQMEAQTCHVFGVVTLVRNGDFSKAMAQHLLQLEATLRWRSISLSTNAKTSYGIVTDAVDWYFIECSISPLNPLRPKFRVTPLGFNRIRYHGKWDWKLDSQHILGLVISLFGRIQTEIRKQGGQLGLEPPVLRPID